MTADERERKGREHRVDEFGSVVVGSGLRLSV